MCSDTGRPALGTWQSFPGGRLFFQPFEAYFVENLPIPAAKKGPEGQKRAKSNRKTGEGLNIPARADANYACQQRKGGGHRPPGTEHAR